MKMRKQLKICILSLLAFAMLLCALPAFADSSSSVYTNPETGYRIVIEDDANLLSDNEKYLLAEDMKPITAYGNVAFTTTNTNNYSSSLKYAGDFCYRHFGNASSTVFLIDMAKRQITIASDGAMYKTITTGKANTIVDNCYWYATNKMYYSCAQKVFSQMISVLEGGRIAQPMKYASNILIALLAGMLVNFVIIGHKARLRAPKYSEILSASGKNYFRFANPRVTLTKKGKRYSPIRTGGGHFSGGGGGGGFSGGGHFSGGGGSHGF